MQEHVVDDWSRTQWMMIFRGSCFFKKSKSNLAAKAGLDVALGHCLPFVTVMAANFGCD